MCILMSDVEQTRQEREWKEKEKNLFMFELNVSHKTTKTSSRAIVRDHLGHFLVQY